MLPDKDRKKMHDFRNLPQLERGVFDVFQDLRAQLGALGLEPPSVIILRDHEQGMRLLSAIDREAERMGLPRVPKRMMTGAPIEQADGSICIEFKIMDMIIRFPAVKQPTGTGPFDFRWI